MIFIVLGSQKFQFNRLLQYIDELVLENKLNEKIVAQSGHSDYIPSSYSVTPFFDKDKFIKNIQQADVVVTHAGTGAIVTALKNDKKVIAVPRLKQYLEHVDDHQIQIVKNFVEKNYIFAANNKYSLNEKLLTIQNHRFDKFKSNNSEYISIIKDFVIND